MQSALPKLCVSFKSVIMICLIKMHFLKARHFGNALQFQMYANFIGKSSSKRNRKDATG